jgi:cysteine-rich repeat protein
LDENSDGVLEASEISSTSYVCNGAPGSQVRVTPEPPGANCTAGGQRIDIGSLVDGGFQTQQVAYTCNGVSGAADAAPDESSGMDASSGMMDESPDAAVCGNGIREAPEQCDDGNLVNLDGCDSDCKFEQDLRITSAILQPTADSTCAGNAFGHAFSTVVLNAINANFAGSLRNGSASTLFKLSGLHDLTGSNDPAVTLGALTGAPVASSGYDGTSDLDWWYGVAPGSIDANRNANVILSASISASKLTTNPGNFDVSLFATPLSLTNATIFLPIGAASVPTASAGSPPGHLAVENLDPRLTSFAFAGQASSTGLGELCGSIVAGSLSAVPIPTSLTGCSTLTACVECYTASNSMLDLLVGGCHSSLLGTLVAPTQPDGGTFAFVTGANGVINGCVDKSGAPIPFLTCLEGAGYSSLFAVSADRVIVK